MWTNAAVHILREHRPNLLLFHLLALDSTQHRYGPRTPAAMTAMAHLDSQVARVVKAIEETGLMPRTTIFVLSDHGFKVVKRQILANAALMKAGLLKVEDGKITASQAYVVPEGGSALVYVTVPDPAGDILNRDEAGSCRPRRHRQGDRAARIRAVRIALAVRQPADGRALPHGEVRVRVCRRHR